MRRVFWRNVRLAREVRPPAATIPAAYLRNCGMFAGISCKARLLTRRQAIGLLRCGL
jgi:hypothetical protein